MSLISPSTLWRVWPPSPQGRRLLLPHKTRSPRVLHVLANRYPLQIGRFVMPFVPIDMIDNGPLRPRPKKCLSNQEIDRRSLTSAPNHDRHTPIAIGNHLNFQHLTRSAMPDLT